MTVNRASGGTFIATTQTLTRQEEAITELGNLRVNAVSKGLTRCAGTYNSERQKELLVQPPTAFWKDGPAGC